MAVDAQYFLHILSILTPYTPFLSFLLFYLVYIDYQDFLSLGPGGTPSTPLGYLRIKFLSLFALREPYIPAPIPPHFRPQSGYLQKVPIRPGGRPVVRGIAPQRQKSEPPPPEVYAELAEALKRIANEQKNNLFEGTSCFEKHGTGLFATAPITRTCKGEVCHVHGSDGSLHLTLHPADAKLVLESCWGERHPLARGGWFRRFVPREFVMIYAPRNSEEIEIICEIVAAAVWWVSGVSIKNSVDDLNDRTKETGSGGDCWACRTRMVQKS